VSGGRRGAVLGIVVAAVVAGAIGVGAGTIVGRSGNGSGAAVATGGGTPSAGAGMSGATGKVTETSADGLTIRTADGSTRNVYVTGSTAFSTVSTASVADVSLDTTVSVDGTSSASGDLAARRVTIGGGLGGVNGRRPGQ
jgi:hypothetical protein